MVMPLPELLERRFGVDEEQFAAALIEFTDRTGPLTLVDLHPTDYFGERQQASLRRLGASLKPLQPNELGPVAGLVVAHAELVARSLSVAEIAKHLEVDTSRVRQRIYAHSLYAFKHRGGWRLPAFQFQDGRIVPGLDVVVAALHPLLHPLAVSRWFTTSNNDLLLADEAVSPIVWLASGGPPEQVTAMAGNLDQL